MTSDRDDDDALAKQRDDDARKDAKKLIDMIRVASRRVQHLVADALVREMDSDLIGDLPLEQVRAELRAVSGQPMRGDDDRMRRRALWHRLDLLTSLNAVTRQPCAAARASAAL
jgi:hypothetical protein